MAIPLEGSSHSLDFKKDSHRTFSNGLIPKIVVVFVSVVFWAGQDFVVQVPPKVPLLRLALRRLEQLSRAKRLFPVSYTHLTLPTIYSV